MFAFASVIASPEKYERCAVPGLALVTEPDSVVAESTDAVSMCSAYNEILDAFAGRDDLEALVLLHEDTEIRDPAFCAKVRARFAEDDLAVLGVAGARGVRSLHWWEGECRGRVGETRGLLDFGGLGEDVDSVDGLLMVLSPWAVRNLRFDAATFDGFHAYDVDFCFQARAAGRRVAVEDIDVFHHTKGGYGDRAAFERGNTAFQAKWGLGAAAPAPLVSILIPTYNRPVWAVEALRSAQAQTHPNLEILVSDNGSTDDTADALEAAAAGDARVTVRRRPENVDFHRNTIGLVEQARGDYVKFLLDDDLLMPDAVESLLAPMLADPSVTLSTSKRKPIDGNGDRLPESAHTQAITDRQGLIDGAQLGGLILTTTTNWIGEASTVLFRRADVLPADELWSLDGRESLGNPDIALWLKLLGQGPCAYTPRELTAFRVHEAQGGRQVWAQIRGLADWPYLIDGGRARGFLTDPAAEQRAWAQLLGHVGRLLPHASGERELAQVSEALELAHGRLAELRDGIDPGASGARIDLRVRARTATPA